MGVSSSRPTPDAQLGRALRHMFPGDQIGRADRRSLIAHGLYTRETLQVLPGDKAAILQIDDLSERTQTLLFQGEITHLELIVQHVP